MYSTDCKVTDWGKWSECKANYVKNEASPPFSFPLPATEEPDRGRAMMEIAMEEKAKVVDERRQCLEDQTCPQFNPRPTVVGKTKCVDGKLRHWGLNKMSDALESITMAS